MLTCTATDAVTLRRQAGDLLDRLLADREAIDRRLSESGKRDPIRCVTGRSALENAIASTRDMIARMDLLLAELDGGIQALGVNGSSAVAPPPREVEPSISPLPFAPLPNRQRTRGMLPGRQRSVAATA